MYKRNKSYGILMLSSICLTIGLSIHDMSANSSFDEPPNQCYYAEAGPGSGYYKCDFTLQGCAWVENKVEDMVKFSDGCYVTQE